MKIFTPLDQELLDAEIAEHARYVIAKAQAPSILSIKTLIDHAVNELSLAERGPEVRLYLKHRRMVLVLKAVIEDVCPFTVDVTGQNYQERAQQTLGSIDFTGHCIFFVRWLETEQHHYKSLGQRSTRGHFSCKSDAAMFQLCLPDS